MSSATVNSDTNRKKDNPLNVLNWSMLLISLPLGIINFVLPIYGKQIGASAVEIGLLFSSFAFMSVILRPLIGAGLDRFGRRWFFIAGLASYALTMTIFASADQVYKLVGARIAQGTAAALLGLAVNAIVADLAGADRRGQSFGGVTQAANQGGILGTFIGFSILMSQGIAEGWRLLFYGYALVGLAAVLMAWRRLPETRPPQVETRQSLWPVLHMVLRSRSLSLLMLVGLVTGASWAMTSPILMFFLQDKFQAELAILGLAFLPSGIVWAVLPSRLGQLSDRFGRKPLIVLALVIAAINNALIPAANSLVFLAILWAVEAACFAASDPAGAALITDLTAENQRGRAFGLFALAGGLGAVIGPLAGGWLYQTLGPAIPFLTNSLVLAVCAGVIGVGLKGAEAQAKG